MTKTGTVIFLRSPVKSVWENAAGAAVNTRDLRVSGGRGLTGRIPGERGYDKNQPRRLP